LPKIHKRSNPPERNGLPPVTIHSGHNSQVAKTPTRSERVNNIDSQANIRLANNEINDISNAERRQKNNSKNQVGKINYEELLINEKRKVFYEFHCQ